MNALNNITRLLVPVNLKPEGEALLRYAGNWASLLGAELILLHTTGLKELTYTQKSRTIQSLRSYGERTLHQHYRSGSRFGGYVCVVRPGTLDLCLHDVAQEYEAQLILLPAERCAVEGSAAANLPAPVMLVSPKVQYSQPRHILFATDFTDRDPHVLQRINAFARQASAKLILVHVYSTGERTQLCTLKSAMCQMRLLLPSKNISLKLLEEDDMLEGISEFAEQEQADMLLFATQDNYLMQHLFSKTYVKTHAYHTRIPLLNFWQQKHKPCSGNCTNCTSKLQHAHHLPLKRLSLN